MRNAFVKELGRISEDPRVLILLADNGIIVFDEYRKQYPKQFFNLGISEQSIVGVAAGLASAGYLPFFYTILPFVTKRAFEFVRDDVCYQKMNVKLVGMGAGFAYSALGPTHHGTEDIAMTRPLPGLTIFSPADPMETMKATRAAYEIQGPVYLRIGKGKDPIVYREDYEFVPGRGVTLREGKDLAIIATGTINGDALAAADLLAKQGIDARVINIHTLKPLDREILVAAARETGAVLTVEEHSVSGGLGGAVAEVLLEEGVGSIRFKRMGFHDTFCHGYGSVEELREKSGLAPADIARTALALLGHAA